MLWSKTNEKFLFIKFRLCNFSVIHTLKSMILLSILFQNLGKFLCLKLLKTKLSEVRKLWNWKRFVYEFSGTIFLFLLSLTIYIAMMTYHGKVYLANDSLIYGIEVSETAESIGFRDGDKLVTINGEKIKEFRAMKLVFDLLLEDNAYVDMNRSNTEIRLEISDEQKRIIASDRNDFIKAKYPEKLALTYENYSISELTTGFYRNTKVAVEYAKTLIIGPSTVGGYKRVGPIAILDVYNFPSFLSVLSFSSLLLIIINLIPLPGLDSGNLIIALIEHKRENIFPPKKLRNARFIGIGLLICWVLISVFLL
jgi:membrane-associated protease RseP (regulator of RpoE activity)